MTFRVTSNNYLSMSIVITYAFTALIQDIAVLMYILWSIYVNLEYLHNTGYRNKFGVRLSQLYYVARSFETECVSG